MARLQIIIYACAAKLRDIESVLYNVILKCVYGWINIAYVFVENFHVNNLWCWKFFMRLIFVGQGYPRKLFLIYGSIYVFEVHKVHRNHLKLTYYIADTKRLVQG